MFENALELSRGAFWCPDDDVWGAACGMAAVPRIVVCTIPARREEP